MSLNNLIPEFKIIAIGDSGVGKTSIFKRFAHNKFDEDTMSTIGLAFADKKLTLKSKEKVQLKLVDTGGQERYRSLAKSYYKNADGVLFVFAHNDKESFDNIKDWIQLYDENASNKETPKFLIGNKNDLGKLDEEEAFNTFIKEHNILRYKSTSAKDNINITETFEDMADIIDSNFNKKGKQQIINLTNKEKKRDFKCNLCQSDIQIKN